MEPNEFSTRTKFLNASAIVVKIGLKFVEFKGSTNYYGMSLTKGEVIDARACGGIARFVNHSCNPNCVVERWEVNGEIYCGFFREEVY
ncbi:hypothetical protein F444_04303 [Phytophthora nicotianae P1976]|uniref:SET domain-containing protein n=1 Tax=Phytophthora nicotianae P1976 TaxID=1317066 RepID=A0A081AR87_PHYNI|nr:hypothetical protein F444_04303 [Phytophthora nicotianae P1976]